MSLPPHNSCQWNDYPRFTGEETEAQRGKVTHLRKWVNWNLNSALTGFSKIFGSTFKICTCPLFPNHTVITWSSHSHISVASSLVSLNTSSLPTSLLIIPGTLLPQGLCTGCSFCLEYSSPNGCISLFQVCAQMSPH